MDLPEFIEIKRIRSQDIRSFNFHWSSDRDLILWNRFLLSSYLFGFGITIFSYFFFMSSLGVLADEYTFSLIKFTISFRKIQYFLGMNFVGPIILIMCIIIKFLLNMHVIFCRNPSTIFKGLASISSNATNILGVGSFLIGVAGIGFGIGDAYNSGIGPDFLAKNSVDSIKDGVIRHTPVQEKAFLNVKKTGLTLPPNLIVESKTNKVLDMDKLHTQLCLIDNASYVEKIPAPELHAMGFTDLISDIKLLRHNLLVYTNIDNGFSKADYIIRFNCMDKEDRLILGVSSPSKEELHLHYSKLAATLCKTPKDIESFNEFINGKSDNLFYSMKFQKEFGVLSTKKNFESYYVQSNNPKVPTDYERIARKIPQILLDKKVDLKENVGEYILEQIKKPLPPLIKNEPENP